MADEDRRRGGSAQEHRTPSPRFPEAVGSDLRVFRSSLYAVASICCLMILVLRQVVSCSKEGGPSGPALILASLLGCGVRAPLALSLRGKLRAVVYPVEVCALMR